MPRVQPALELTQVTEWSNGTARRIEDLPTGGGTSVFGPAPDGGMATARQTALISQGIRDCVSLTLQDGRVTNPNFLDYRIPGFQDVPEIHVKFIETMDPYGPFGAKSIGESSLNPAAAAICNAINNAVGVRIHRVPVTPERLWELMQAAAPGDPDNLEDPTLRAR